MRRPRGGLNARAIRALLRAADQENLRAELVEDLLPPAIEMLRAGVTLSNHTCSHCRCHRPQRWAVRDVMDLARLRGMDQRLVETFLGQLGVATLAELSAMVTVSRTADSTPLPEKVRRCVEWLNAVYSTHPELRALAQGVEPDDPEPPRIASQSSAEEVT